jgi:dipeptidyl aminopeptidase/acylaminoacyl peptidase
MASMENSFGAAGVPFERFATNRGPAGMNCTGARQSKPDLARTLSPAALNRPAHPMNPLLTVVLAVLLGACSLLEPGPESAPPSTAAPSTPTATTTAAPASGVAPSRTPPPAVALETLAPNANLFIQGIPPVPMSLAQNVAPYTEFRGHSFVDWHPTRREMLVSHRKLDGQTTQLFRLTAPMAEPEAMTDFADPVRVASYEPRQGRYLVFERATGGNEANQVYRLDLPSKQITLLTDPDERHSMQGWMHRTSALLVSSVPLDKTATGGSRSEVNQTLRLIDPAQPGVSRKIAELPGTGWYVGAVSWDDRQVALTRYLSANESQVWLLNLATGKTTQLLPAPAANVKAVHFAGPFTRDNGGLFVISDRDGEFRELMLYRSANKRLQSLTNDIPWDTDDMTISDGGRWLAARLNVDGRDELRLFDAQTLKETALPALPAGGVRSAQFHRKLPELAFALDSSKGPSQIHSFNAATGKTEQWTQPVMPPGLDLSGARQPEIVRWTSFDQRSISGVLTRPPARFTGKRPVMVLIHGGPEGQAKLGFLGRYNYFVNELGVAIIEPNVRGSSGYGKTFLTLDNGMLREDSVRDIGSLFDWIATQPDLDASRVLVSGGSYGGYMSLAVSARYASRIAGAIEVVGISNFVTFLNNTESYRRDLRRVEYGDERDPQMKDFLERISPTNQAQRISKPLFVVQGRNDPRVPYTEAEQIVAKARVNNPSVWYLRAENEGHGFVRKENADYQFYATVMFVRATLLK